MTFTNAYNINYKNTFTYKYTLIFGELNKKRNI